MTVTYLSHLIFMLIVFHFKVLLKTCVLFHHNNLLFMYIFLSVSHDNWVGIII